MGEGGFLLLEFFGILKYEWVKVENRIFGDDKSYYEFLLLYCSWEIIIIKLILNLVKFRKVCSLHFYASRHFEFLTRLMKMCFWQVSRIQNVAHTRREACWIFK